MNLKKLSYVLFVLVLGVFSSCNATNPDTKSSTKDFTAFSIDGATGVITDTSATEGTVLVTLPFGTGVTELVATFTTNGSSVAVGSTPQISGTTSNSFESSTVHYIVTAADGTTKDYAVTVAREPGSPVATLKASSTVKGQVLSGLGNPNEVLGSATPGAVTITWGKAQNTTNATTFITLFDPSSVLRHEVKVVKYTTGAPTTNFADDAIYTNQVIANQDFFIIRVTAQDETTVLYYKVIVTVSAITIGEPYLGGVIAYIFQAGAPADPGYIAGQTHGLIAALTDISASAPWGCSGTSIPTAQGTVLGTGKDNTAAIVGGGGCGTAGIAARLCYDYSTGDNSDLNSWYLPSKDELNKLYLSKDLIHGFAFDKYWSSSGYSATHAWNQDFLSGNPGGNYKNTPYYVRCARAF